MGVREALLGGQEGVSPLPSLEDIWRRYDAIESRLTAPLSERMLDLAGLQPGMHVLESRDRPRGAYTSSCIAGSESRGSVLGVDLSGAMLRMARETADRDGLTNLDLREGNAESLDDIPRNHFHAATVRWGLMYMEAPVAALATARRALVPTGVLVAALWAEPERASFFTMPRRLLERYRSLPTLDPEAPGMFRYADLERVVRDFDRAGFTLDHVEDMELPVFEAKTGEEVVAWVRALGSGMGATLERPAGERAARVGARRDGRGGTNSTDGLIRLGGVTRLVRTRPIEPVTA